jgi:prefoldin subunit 5
MEMANSSFGSACHSRYKQITGIDTRLERLDGAVAETERRIKDLTKQAEQYAANYNFKKLDDTLNMAEKLQSHNSKLLKSIQHTEQKLSAVAKKVANEVKQIEK